MTHPVIADVTSMRAAVGPADEGATVFRSSP